MSRAPTPSSNPLSSGDSPAPSGAAETAQPFDTLGALEQVGALQQAGKLKDAFDLCREVNKKDPDNADAFNLGGVIAFQGGNKSFAVKLLRQAVGLSPDHAGAYNNLGIVLKETKKLDEAVVAFDRSLELNPDDADTHYNLGNTLNLLAKHEEAAKAYGRAVTLRPGFADADYNQAMMLVSLERFAEAADAFGRVVELKPDFEEAQFEYAKALYQSGQSDAATEAFNRVRQFDLSNTGSFYRKSVATNHTSGPQALVEFCDARLAEEPADQVALSTKAIALYEAGENEAGRALVDFDRFIRPVRLSAPGGFDSMAAFNAALVEHIRNHPTLEYEPQTQATRFGRHTGIINRDPMGPIKQFEAAVTAAVTDYMSAVPSGKPHPFLNTMPSNWQLNIWAIIMQAQGHQVPHIHPQAWLSGVYYPKLPQIIDTADADKSGWIEFGEPPEDIVFKQAPEVEIYKPEEGQLFLFPSYFYHRTIPFDSTEERVSIAFDVIADD